MSEYAIKLPSRYWPMEWYQNHQKSPVPVRRSVSTSRVWALSMFHVMIQDLGMSVNRRSWMGTEPRRSRSNTACHLFALACTMCWTCCSWTQNLSQWGQKSSNLTLEHVGFQGKWTCVTLSQKITQGTRCTWWSPVILHETFRFLRYFPFRKRVICCEPCKLWYAPQSATAALVCFSSWLVVDYFHSCGASSTFMSLFFFIGSAYYFFNTPSFKF